MPAYYPEVIYANKTTFPLFEKVGLIYPDGFQLVSVKNDDQLVDSFTESVNCNSQGTPNDSPLDLTGSPLKGPEDMVAKLGDLEITHSISEASTECFEHFTPLTLTHARSHLSLLNLMNRDKAKDVPLWIMCNGSDSNKTLLIHTLDTEETLISGNISLAGSNLKETDLPNMSSLTMKHATYGGQEISQTISALYVIHQAIKTPNSYLKLQCYWANSKFTLSPPTSDAEVTMFLAVNLTDEDCMKVSMIQQMQDIGTLISSLKSLEIIWPSKTPCTELMKELKDRIGRRKKTQYYDFYSTDNLDKSSKKFVDFTDELWDVLQHCCLYKDLALAFEYVFNVTVTKMFSPVISSDNTTQAGRMLRKLVSHDDDFSAYLLGTKPMEMLIEIGLLSFQRQVAREITEENKFISVSDVLSYVDSITYQSHHTCISKLVLLSEALALWRKYIKSTSGTAPCRLKEAILKKLFAHNDPVMSETFSLPVSAKDMIALIKDLNPCDWMLTLKSKNRNVNVVTRDLMSTYEYPYVKGRANEVSSDFLSGMQTNCYNWYHIVQTQVLYS